MTRKQDELAIDAAKAAQLVKATADQTATALNIQYIQQDIAEIKANVKSLTDHQDGQVEELQRQLDALSKIVYVGLGTLSGLTLLLQYINHRL